MADKKFEGGMFGGLGYKPLGWEEASTSKKNDNPFFTQPAVSGPLQPIDQGAKDQLAAGMTSWYKAGRPSGFKNVEDKTAQKLDTGAESGIQTLQDMSFPGLNMKALDQVPSSTNIEDRRPGMSSETFNKVAAYNNAQPDAQPNQLDMITAGLRMPGGPLQPVQSVPASSRLYKPGDDPFAEMIASKGTFDPIEFMLGLLGGPRNRPFAPPSPPVRVQAGGPNFSVNAGAPLSPMDASLSRTNQIWNTANEGVSLPTRVNTDAQMAQELAAMLKPPGEVVPIRKSMEKGNIRNQTEDEVLAGIDKQWGQMTKGGPFTEATPQSTAIDTILGGLKQKPNLRVVSDNTSKPLQIKDQAHLNELIANAEGDTDIAAIVSALQRQGMMIPKGLQ